MITFKQFIAEGAVDKLPEFEKVKTKAAVKMLNEHCKDALWMLYENKPLYRGEKGLPKGIASAGFVSVDPSKTERESQNTSNYYTMILDNHPDRKDFPKRSRSFIGTRDKSNAESYTGWSGGGAAFVMIPYDGVKIGVVGRDDMWDTRISMFGMSDDIAYFNRKFKSLDLKPTLKSFEEYGKKLATDRDTQQHFRRVFDDASLMSMQHFMDTIWKAYSVDKTKHQAYTTKTFPHDTTGEVWVGGPVVYISLKMWAAMRKTITGKDSDSKYFD
jgi:hypothetical protein